MDAFVDTPYTRAPHFESTHNAPNLAPVPTPVRPDLIPGLTLVKALGQGSSATVYLAHGEEGEVAVKILASQYIDHEEVAKRWERETQTLVSLNHPNVVRGIRRGVAEGRPYLVMELVRGEALSSRLRRLGRLPESECLHVGRAVLEALHSGAPLELIHRDIKPANIIRSEDGAIKLTDFGLAKALDDETITVLGVMIGTPAFISPEQARGDRHIDPRTDLYSLGVTLFQLATGDIPFSSLNGSLLLTKKVTDDVPDPRSLRRELSGPFAYLVSRLCQRDRESRPPSAAAALELLHAVEQQDVPTEEYSSVLAPARTPPESVPTEAIAANSPLLGTVVTDPELRKSSVFVPEGSILFYEDDRSRDCYVLLNGEAEVLKSGRQVAVISDAGSFIGEMSALLNAPRTATIRAVRNSTFLRIAEADFHSFLKRHPEMSYQLAVTLAQRLDKTTRRLTEAQAKLATLQRHMRQISLELK